jgi:hypothetical protein
LFSLYISIPHGPRLLRIMDGFFFSYMWQYWWVPYFTSPKVG